MSQIVAELIELQTGQSNQVLRLANVEKFPDGSGYCCDLTVVSEGFSCQRRFYLDDGMLAPALAALRTMAEELEGSCVLKQTYEDDFIRLACVERGHVIVSGEIHEHQEVPQLLLFGFTTDQSVLRPFAEALQKLMDA